MIENWRGLLSGLFANLGESAQPVTLSAEQPVTFSAELRSRHPHVGFDATFQVWGLGNDQAAYWALRQQVTEWADQVTARYCVTQAGNAENEINARIAHRVRVRLTVSRQARAAAEAMLEIDRQAALDRLKQGAELERIRYLRENVYSRPDVARSYWLYHHPDRPDELLNDRFEKIAAKFGDVGESQSLVIAKLIGEFLGGLDDGERRYLLGQLGQVFSSYDRPDLAKQVDDA